MFEEVMLNPAAALPALTTIYWTCLIIGGGLLAISTLAGGDADLDMGADVDVDFDVDVDVDVDADVAVDGPAQAGHAHAGSLTTWFSTQFLVFFTAVFGVVGVTLTHLSGNTAGVTFAVSLIAGLLVGQGVHQLLRKLRGNSGDSTPKPEDYVNKLARVTVTVRPEQRGEVALRVGRAERFVPAICQRAEDTFSPGQQVGVVAYRDGTVEVVSRKEYEFVKSEG